MINNQKQLPKGWEMKNLGEVVEFQRGLTYSKNDEVDFSDNIVLRSNNVDLKTNKLDFTELKYLNPKIEIPENKKVSKGSLIICTANGSKSHLGKVALIKEDYNFAFGGFMGLINPKQNLNSDYLFHIMTSDFYKKFIGALSDGANINNLKFSDLESFTIPIPPLEEQKQIVAILDEAFGAIEKAKANAEQNLKNAKELFESYLQGVFENKGEDWEEKRLGEVCDVIGGGTPSKANTKFYDGDIFWATVRDMKGEIISDTEHKITKEAVKNSSTNIIPKGNVVIATRVGLGKVCLIENDTAINQDLRGIVPISTKKISVVFLYHWLKSIAFKIVEEGTGATVQGVKLPFIKSLVIPFPSLKEQQEIVEKLDALKSKTKKLEVINEQKIKDLEELKKSILEKAFSGELLGEV